MQCSHTTALSTRRGKHGHMCLDAKFTSHPLAEIMNATASGQVHYTEFCCGQVERGHWCCEGRVVWTSWSGLPAPVGKGQARFQSLRAVYLSAGVVWYQECTGAWGRERVPKTTAVMTTLMCCLQGQLRQCLERAQRTHSSTILITCLQIWCTLLCGCGEGCGAGNAVELSLQQ